jgi:hypothetical protein
MEIPASATAGIISDDWTSKSGLRSAWHILSSASAANNRRRLGVFEFGGDLRHDLSGEAPHRE